MRLYVSIQDLYISSTSILTIHDYEYSYDIQCIINVIAHGFCGIIANYKCMQISRVIIFEVL